MTQLPQKDPPPAYALQWLEERKDLNIAGVAALQPGAGKDFVRQHFQLIAMSGALGMMWVIDNARAGWDEADAALRELAIELMHRKQCPALLESYAMEALRPTPQHRRGRRKSTNALQDLMFVVLVDEVARQFNLDPTRNTNSQHPDSACDVVAVAINRTAWLKRSVQYKAVEALWLHWFWTAISLGP